MYLYLQWGEQVFDTCLTDVSISMLHGWDGVLGVVLILLLPPNTVSGVWTKKLLFLSYQTT
jgi:hypothetical protein